MPCRVFAERWQELAPPEGDFGNSPAVHCRVELEIGLSAEGTADVRILRR